MFDNDIVHSAKESQDWLKALFYKVDDGIQYCTDTTGPVHISIRDNVLKILYAGILKDSTVVFERNATVIFSPEGKILKVESINKDDLRFISDALDPYFKATREGNISKLTGPLLQQALNFQLCSSGKMHGGYIYKYPQSTHYECTMLIGA